MKKILYLSIFFSLFLFTSCEKEVDGCTDSDAINYASDATNDDGSCLYNFIKRWNITSLTLDGTELVSDGDYIEFFDDGSYLSYTGGIFELGTYTSSTSSITFSTFEIDDQEVYVTYTVSANMSSSSNLTLTGTLEGQSIVMTATAA